MRKIEFPYYALNLCRGFEPQGCRFNVVKDKKFVEQIISQIERSSWKKFMDSQKNGPLKAHEKLKISFSGCPNGCSRPHIHDLGIIGAVKPEVVAKHCLNCGICSETCREQAISSLNDIAQVDYTCCLYCGECVRACPEESMKVSQAGFRLVVGGRLGRHPCLARDLGMIFTKNQQARALDILLDFHRKGFETGTRLSQMIQDPERIRTVLKTIEDKSPR